MTDASEPESPGTYAGGTAEETLRALLQRERADFLNCKRWVALERSEDRERAQIELLAGLLPFLDDIDRALEHVPVELARHPWVRGLVMTRRQLNEFLQRSGATRFGASGDCFDPNLHEAVAFEAHPGLTEPVISRVIRPGYRLGKKVLRPAQVTVIGPS